MAHYYTKPIAVEAITFDELVEYGKTHGGNIVNGMPWSFDYAGKPITHENDTCYLIPVAGEIVRFEPGNMLITQPDGTLSLCSVEVFAATYEPAAHHLNVTVNGFTAPVIAFE